MTDSAKVRKTITDFWNGFVPLDMLDSELFLLVTNLYIQACYSMIDSYPQELRIQDNLAEGSNALTMLIIDRGLRREGKPPMVHATKAVN